MPDIKNTTRAQTLFLRAFAKNPAGPPPDQWPSALHLRRWLKRPGFCGAMNSILTTLRYQADFHLTAAAASGSHLLHTSVLTSDPDNFRKQIDSLTHLLRLAHIRHRFAEPLPTAPVRNLQLLDLLKTCHPDATAKTILEYYENHTSNPGEAPDYPLPVESQ